MSQSLSQLWIHVIFSTKKRLPFLKQHAIQEKLHQYIKALCFKKNCNLATIGGTEDHIHLLLSLHRNIALANLVEEIKKHSSKWIKTLNKYDPLLSRFYWQSGYGAFSVSASNVEQVKLYIKNQQQHHKKQSFQDELRKFLMQHGITYDEKYVWN